MPTPMLMALAIVCGSHTGVDTCLSQADTVTLYAPTKAGRHECVMRGKELAEDAKRAFGYVRIVEPFRVKIHCVSKKPSVEPAVKGKPDYSGKESASRPAPVAHKAPEPAAISWWSWFWKWPL